MANVGGRGCGLRRGDRDAGRQRSRRAPRPGSIIADTRAGRFRQRVLGRQGKRSRPVARGIHSTPTRCTPRTAQGETPGADKAETTGAGQADGGSPTVGWAPVQAADSYEVALYRGATRVFSERTRQASIEIGIARSPAGAVGHRALSPGTYTWYVWPWRGGHRLGRAVVASKLVLTAAGA
jgi:hypothetical protein